jgi:hypothetical protein
MRAERSTDGLVFVVDERGRRWRIVDMRVSQGAHRPTRLGSPAAECRFFVCGPRRRVVTLTRGDDRHFEGLTIFEQFRRSIPWFDGRSEQDFLLEERAADD